MEYNLAVIAAAIADAVPDRDYFVQGETRLTYRQFMDRVHQMANALVDLGLGCHTERDALAGHESGQDHLALYLYNGPEFLVANVGAFAARVAPFNVNYRYVDDELVYLLNDQKTTAIVYPLGVGLDAGADPPSRSNTSRSDSGPRRIRSRASARSEMVCGRTFFAIDPAAFGVPIAR